MRVLDIFKGKMKKSKGMVAMPKKALKKEHKELVKTLKSGSKSERMREAKEQSKEMKGYK